MNNAILSSNAICKTIPQTSNTLELVILHPITLQIQAGETVAIVGASGSGKSTLLSLLAGLDAPTAGDVEVAGLSLFGQGNNEDTRASIRAQHMAFVFQNFQLLDNYTALENVMLPLELQAIQNNHKHKYPSIDEQATNMLQRVGLGEKLHHYPKVLSGGEQQRVALARAFVVQPSILLADEPTGSLDHATAQTTIELMFELNQEYKTTLILVTHDPKLAQRCQRILTLTAGRISTPTLTA